VIYLGEKSKDDEKDPRAWVIQTGKSGEENIAGADRQTETTLSE